MMGPSETELDHFGLTLYKICRSSRIPICHPNKKNYTASVKVTDREICADLGADLCFVFATRREQVHEMHVSLSLRISQSHEAAASFAREQRASRRRSKKFSQTALLYRILVLLADRRKTNTLFTDPPFFIHPSIQSTQPPLLSPFLTPFRPTFAT